MLYKLFKNTDKYNAEKFSIENKGRMLDSLQTQEGDQYWVVIHSEGVKIDLDTYELNWNMSEMEDVNNATILELAEKLNLYDEELEETKLKETKLELARHLLNTNIHWAYSFVHGSLWTNIGDDYWVRLSVDTVRRGWNNDDYREAKHLMPN